MEFKDYYKVMGVERDATEAQIKHAYRKLARKYHPDVSKEKDAEARFKDVGEAYEVLRSPDKRAAYDQLGKHSPSGNDFRAPPGWDSDHEFSSREQGSGHGGRADYSDFFETLFGGAARGARRAHDSDHSNPGEDHHAKVVLDLEASLQGGTRTITLMVPEIDADGRLAATERVLNVQIPKGIVAGQTIRLAGQGAPSHRKGSSGNLFIEVEFAPHAWYRIDGRDLHLQLPVSPWEAALGATVQTPTPSGEVDLKIPAGAHTGSKLRLKGRGIPSNPPGDFFVEVQIVLPPALDDKAKAAYQALAAALPFNPRANLRSLDS